LPNAVSDRQGTKPMLFRLRHPALVCWALLISCAAALLAVVGAGPSSDQPLPRDPNNVYGKFDNGLSYITRRNTNPPGKVSLDLHVRTGALNETDQQNGLAHFIEHMAFNGSGHYPAGELRPHVNHLGIAFGRDS